MSDAIERLAIESLRQAADEITRLRAENAELRARYSLASARVDALWRTKEQLRAQLAAKDARIAKLEAELRKIIQIIYESKGVAGFHLNGELAEWGYFDLPQTIEEALRDE